MKTLSPTLLAAQKAGSAAPYVRAVFSDHHGDVSRIRPARHYTGSEGEYFSAVAGAGDGSLIRARIDPTTKVLYSQRVTSPGPASDFSSWTSHGTVSATGAVALAVDGANVFLFYVDTDNLTLRVKQSTDNGASYGSPATVATASASVTYLAAAVASGGDRVLFWVEGAIVYRSRFSGGSWGARTAWSNSVASVTGIACKYQLDFNLALCGTENTSGDAKVWTAIFGDGFEESANVWSGLREVTTATANTGVSFRSPAIDYLQHWRLFFVEKYTGTQSYSRLQWSTMHGASSFSNDQWREPAAFDYEGDYGVAAAVVNLGGYLWLSAAAGVWSGLSPSQPELDVSNDVVEAVVDVVEGGASARLVLRNDPTGVTKEGRYAGYAAGSLSVLQRGARLQITPGFRTSAGAETPAGDAYWIESIEQTTGSEARLIVHARDAFWLLEQWRAKHQFYWPTGTLAVSQLLQFVCAKAGLELTFESSSDTVTSLQPAFTIHPGESGLTAVRRLLAMVADVAFAQGSALRMRYPQEVDEPSYAYARPALGPSSEHAIVSGHYNEVGPATNRVRVLGAGVFSQAFDFSEMDATSERILQVIDLNLTTASLAGERAADELRRASIQARRDEVRIFGVNCGQELYDVVTISDPQAGLEAAARRVLGLRWHYKAVAAAKPRYDMTLRLSNP